MKPEEVILTSDLICIGAGESAELGAAACRQIDKDCRQLLEFGAGEFTTRYSLFPPIHPVYIVIRDGRGAGELLKVADCLQTYGAGRGDHGE